MLMLRLQTSEYIMLAVAIFEVQFIVTVYINQQ